MEVEFSVYYFLSSFKIAKLDSSAGHFKKPSNIAFIINHFERFYSILCVCIAFAMGSGLIYVQKEAELYCMIIILEAKLKKKYLKIDFKTDEERKFCLIN